MRPRSLTPEQEVELLTRYEAWRSNQPKRIARDFGISRKTLTLYVDRARRKAQ